MYKIIESTLRQIQEEQGFKIIYACESGSRAWGFPSEDSDYDVRFLYLHPTNWYLSVDLETRADVFERPITDKLDVSGWDLLKALKLFKKSNPPLLEWLNSPIIYVEMSDIVGRLRALVPHFYSPIACAHHYLHMAQGNYREYLRGDIVWLKKYFYVLRPLLAIRWIEEKDTVVPMEFEILVNHVIPDGLLKQAIESLLHAKKEGKELDRGPKIQEISEFIEAELGRLERQMPKRMGSKPDHEKLNLMFRFALDTAWS